MSCDVDIDYSRVPYRLSIVVPAGQEKRLDDVPGVKRSVRDQSWKAPLSWGSYLALSEVFEDEFAPSNDVESWLKNERAQHIDPALDLREVVHLEGSPLLYPFQRAGVAFLSVAERAILADDMGTGKTRQTLLTMKQLNNRDADPFPALVVCPNAVKESWKREATAVWPELKVIIVEGSRAQRLEQLATPAHVYVMNWESIRFHSSLVSYKKAKSKRCVQCGGIDERIKAKDCQTHERELNRIDFRTVVADEIHRAKDPTAAQTRALWSATGNAQFRYGLSGTPQANNPSDIWALMHWVSPEDFPDYDAFIARYCDVEYGTFGMPNILGIRDDRKEEFFRILDPHMRRMPKALVLRYLPPVVRVRRDVEMTPKQSKAYGQMKKDFLAELDDSHDLSTSNPMARVTRLLQFASSYAHVETARSIESDMMVTTVRLVDPSSKLDAFMNDINDFDEDESVVVFTVSRQLVEMLAARMYARGIKYGMLTGSQDAKQRQESIDKFQAGEYKFILCTIAAGGTGITLTRGSTAVFLQRSWSMIDNEQAEARVHRIGSEIHDSITVIDYVTRDTLEEFVLSVNTRKIDQLEVVLRDKVLLRKLITDNTIDELERSARDND